MRHLAVVTLVLLLGTLGASPGVEPVDLVAVSKIREEGFSRSQVMDILWHLTDSSGPRLTGSPGLDRSAEWSRDKMKSWGMENAELRPWGEFGRGWSLKRFSIHMTKPYYSPIIAFPQAWTLGTGGVVKGMPILVEAKTEEDLSEYKGKLQGRLVLLPLTREAETHFEADAERYTDEDLEKLSKPRVRSGSIDPKRWAAFRERRKLRRKMRKFFREEGVAIVLSAGRKGEHGTVFVGSGGSFRIKEEPGVASAVVAIEHYSRLIRLMDKKVPVEIEVEMETELHEENLEAYNVLAEIPGSDPLLKDEVVMLGAHLDSWHGATGSTDNAAGCAVVMEAARIISTFDPAPRRTVRVALWTGEEQGLLGSRGYVEETLGDRKTMELRPRHEKFSAYFNLDNGTGKIRGVYLQGNAAVHPIFKAYLEPFHDLGATTLTMRNTGGTDHLAFDSLGLPGFQFIQDQIDYSSRTHHSNMDFYDHAVEGDLKQAAIVMASFAYHTAMREDRLPRKPLPEPRKTEVTP